MATTPTGFSRLETGERAEIHQARSLHIDSWTTQTWSQCVTGHATLGCDHTSRITAARAKLSFRTREWIFAGFKPSGPQPNGSTVDRLVIATEYRLAEHRGAVSGSYELWYPTEIQRTQVRDGGPSTGDSR